MKKVNSLFGLALVGFFLLAVVPAWAGPINTDKRGVAIKGYDTVAYFTVGKPVPGKRKFQTAWQGATWYFANPKHRDLFVANPKKYAPQYGGY